jgi:hypothetical protein
VHVARAKCQPDVVAIERPIRAEGNRLVESRNDPRGAFPGIDQPSQPEPGVECFRRASENPPFPSEELEVTLVVLALTENVPKVARRVVAIAGVRPSKKEQPKTKADTHQRLTPITGRGLEEPPLSEGRRGIGPGRESAKRQP